MFEGIKKLIKRFVSFLAQEDDADIKELRGVVPAEYLKQLDEKARKKMILKKKKSK